MFFKKHFLSKEQKSKLVKAIADAEATSSGEIMVHIEPKCSIDVLERATEVFHKLGIQNTKHANGVLIYVAHDDKKFAILGDKEINAVVPANFWDGTKEVMREHFKRSEFYEGIAFAITETGLHLKQYFPHSGEQKNELPNEISEG